MSSPFRFNFTLMPTLNAAVLFFVTGRRWSKRGATEHEECWRCVLGSHRWLRYCSYSGHHLVDHQYSQVCKGIGCELFHLLYLFYNDWLISQWTLSPHRCLSCSSSRMSSNSSVAGERLWKQCQRKMHRRAMIQCRHRIDLVHDLMHQDTRVERHFVRVRRTLARVHSTKLNSNNDNFSCFHE